MTRKVFSAGRWRPRDVLEGFSPAMREALARLNDGPLYLTDGAYRRHNGESAVLPRTMSALIARRCVVELTTSTSAPRPAYRLTARGRAAAAEFLARLEVGRKLFGGNR